MQHNYWIYLFIMFAVTYLVRVLPLVVFKKKITNRFVRSFLTYIPYAVLAARLSRQCFLQWTVSRQRQPV
ncbi:MAG: AzlD domain-containing protein [Coprococcus sp.]